MLKIGDFSRLSRVTIKTLHHYDDIGLLKPAQVDRFTNHRFYEPAQLVRIHRIMALKDLGLSLDQIKRLMDEDLETSQLRGMLRLKQAENEQMLQEAQARLSNVAFHLRMLEMEENAPNIDVVFKEVPPVDALTIRLDIQKEDLIPFGLAFEKAQAAHKIELAGPVGEIRYEEAFEPKFMDVEFYWPVARRPGEPIEMEGFGFMNFKRLPEIQAASFLFMGSDRLIGDKRHVLLEEWLIILQRWLIAHSYKLGGSNRAIYHHGPSEHAAYEDWIVEIQHAVQPAA